MRRALSLLALLAACGGPAAPDPDQPPPGEFLQSLYFRPAREVILDEQTWNITWPQLSGERSPPPAIDFAHFMVLIAALGERPTSGYFVTIDDLRMISDGRLAAVVKESVPGRGCGVLQVTTTPAFALVVPRIGAEVAFSSATQTRDCK